MVGRNAIGLPIVRHDLVQGESAAPFARPFGPPLNRTVGFADSGFQQAHLCRFGTAGRLVVCRSTRTGRLFWAVRQRR